MPRKMLRDLCLAWALTAVFVTPAAAEFFTFGMLMVGPYNDHGYSQACFEGGKYVEKKIPGAKMIYIDKVNPANRPGMTIPQIVDEMVAKGARLIIANSDSMKAGIREAARMHPHIFFLHISGDAAFRGNAPKNLVNLFGQMEYGKMMAGFAAGMTTQTGKIGYLGSLSNDETRRLANSAYLGARYAWLQVRKKNPADLKFEVTWIGFWFNIAGVTADPAQVAQTLFNTGHDVVLSGIDTPEALTVARQKRKRGARVWAIPDDYVGACKGTGDVCLGVPYFNWGPGYVRMIRAAIAGTFKSQWLWLGPDWADINDADRSTVGFMEGDALSLNARKALQTFINDLGTGNLNLFKGPLAFQDGTTFLKDGAVASVRQIWSMPQLLKGMSSQGRIP
jgi:simple sugar transport system substrate-binding protein